MGGIFDRSSLGAFVRSDLGARNKGESGPQIGVYWLSLTNFTNSTVTPWGANPVFPNGVVPGVLECRGRDLAYQNADSIELVVLSFPSGLTSTSAVIAAANAIRDQLDHFPNLRRIYWPMAMQSASQINNFQAQLVIELAGVSFTIADASFYLRSAIQQMFTLPVPIGGQSNLFSYGQYNAYGPFMEGLEYLIAGVHLAGGSGGLSLAIDNGGPIVESYQDTSFPIRTAAVTIGNYVLSPIGFEQAGVGKSTLATENWPYFYKYEDSAQWRANMFLVP